MKVECAFCKKNFQVDHENFCNHEIVFCPICGLDHEIIKSERVVVESIMIR
jgi:hypothetical protein